MNNDERVALINKIKREIDDGYHRRDDYPPYALVSWDDRNRYRQYVFKIMDEFAQGEHQ
jgi:hypothetical protein